MTASPSVDDRLIEFHGVKLPSRKEGPELDLVAPLTLGPLTVADAGKCHLPPAFLKPYGLRFAARKRASRNSLRLACDLIYAVEVVLANLAFSQNEFAAQVVYRWRANRARMIVRGRGR
jgi:hypothetical protein